MQMLFHRLDTLVQVEDCKEKNVEILQASQQLVRALRGGRATCCKSAKDRTSMSTTLENSQILCGLHGPIQDHSLDTKATRSIDDDRKCVHWVANVLREHGVRLMNAKKNQGKKQFAFNSIQRTQLPKFYRPPRMTTGKSVQS